MKALFMPQQPFGMLGEHPALRHHAERRRPEARSEAGIANRTGHRRQSARELRVGLEPVADLALVTVVELDHVDRQLAARGRERVEIPQQIVFGDVVKEVVPGAPTGLERTGDARFGEAPVHFRKLFEQTRRIGSERHAHTLGSAGLSRVERNFEADFRLDPNRLRFAQQVDETGRRAALEHAHRAGRTTLRQAGHRKQIRLVPAGPIGRRCSDPVVQTAKPRTARKDRLSLRVEFSRTGERPRLPTVPEKTKSTGRDAGPPESEHDRLEVERNVGDVADAHVEGSRVALRVDRHP
jgi:hypothetical protein